MEYINIWDDNVPIIKENENFTPFMTFHKAENSIGKSVVVCPGGGYAVCCDTYEGETVAEYFNSFGVDAFVLRYSVCCVNNDKSVFPLPFEDAARAVRYIRANAEKLSVNPDCIGIMGFSAGAHLASWVSTRWDDKYSDRDDLYGSYSARPDFSVFCYGVLDLDKYTPFAVTGINLLGENATDEDKAKFSGPLNVTPQTPPAFLFHTYSDKTVPVMNSLKYYEAMVRCGVKGELHIYEPGDHGMGLCIDVNHIAEKDRKYCEKWPQQLKKWITEMI